MFCVKLIFFYIVYFSCNNDFFSSSVVEIFDCLLKVCFLFFFLNFLCCLFCVVNMEYVMCYIIYIIYIRIVIIIYKR